MEKNDFLERMVAIIQPVMPCLYTMAQQDYWPYCVYSYTEEDLRDKKGVYGCQLTVDLYLIDKDSAKLEESAAVVADGIKNLRSDACAVRIDYARTTTEDSIIWIRNIRLIVKLLYNE